MATCFEDDVALNKNLIQRRSNSSFETESQLSEPLWNHQRKELELHGDAKARGLLWSMRTGKTRVIVESACQLRSEGKVTGLIVIAPNGVHAQWAEREIPRWATCPTVRLTWRSASTKDRDVDAFMLTSAPLGRLYILTLNVDALRVERLQTLVRKFIAAHGNGERVMIVFDESHEFRRAGTRKTRLARGLAKRCRYRRILTGTAALNSPLHLWSQFELLEPNALGHRTFGAFQSYYAEFRQQRRRDGRSYPQLVGYRRLDELQEWVSFWATVVPRSEADVPDVLRTERIVPLSEKQRHVYKELSQGVLKLAREGSDEVEIMAHMMKLQQVLGGFVHDAEGQVHSIDNNPPRLAALVDEVLGSEPQRVIIWCRFREDIRRVRNALHKADVATAEYHGGVSAHDREEAIRMLSHARTPVAFVGQPQAAGQGLDLSAASAVIWYSHVHDAIVREQASARASVKGGKPVALVDLVAEGTMDLGMLELLDGKASLADALTGEGLAALLSGAPKLISNNLRKGLPADDFSEYDSNSSHAGDNEAAQNAEPTGGNIMAKRTKKAATKKAAPKKAKRTGPTIGETACKAIRAGRTNEEALAAVLKRHPDANTTMASVAWYRNDLRKRGEKVPTSREITAARNAKKSSRKVTKKS